MRTDSLPSPLERINHKRTTVCVCVGRCEVIPYSKAGRQLFVPSVLLFFLQCFEQLCPITSLNFFTLSEVQDLDFRGHPGL